MSIGPDRVSRLHDTLARLRAGDASARTDLINHSCERLRLLTHWMLRGYPQLRRWEQTDDILQGALLRLYRSLEEVKPDSVRGFLGLASRQIQRELLDLWRHHFGPRGTGAKHVSDSDLRDAVAAGPADSAPGPASAVALADLQIVVQQKVESLPDAEREVVDLLFYQGLTHEQAAAVLGVSSKSVQRRWLSARLKLHEMLGPQSSEA